MAASTSATLEQAHAELAMISKDYATQFSGKLDANNTSEAYLFVERLITNIKPTFHTLLGEIAR